MLELRPGCECCNRDLPPDSTEALICTFANMFVQSMDVNRLHQTLAGLDLKFCRLVSVRTDEETAALVSLLTGAFGVSVACAAPAREMSGVRNGYEEFERLGLDRWLAMLGGFHLAAGACLVLDFGTAVTADFIAADGQHLGGFICPGMPLMRNQLRTHTRKILLIIFLFFPIFRIT